MSRLDRWLRSANVAPVSPARGDRQSIETKGEIRIVAPVALVASVSRWENRKKAIFTASPLADDEVEQRPRATRATEATNAIPSNENNEIAVAPQGRQGGDKCCVMVDFETRSIGDCDLKSAGAWRYAADSATEILTLAYWHNGEMQLWTPRQDDPGLLAELAADPKIRFVSFAGFEQSVWHHLMVERHGFPPIGIERWVDAQASASYLALPRKLEKVLEVIGAPTRKDAEGARLVKSLSRRNRRTGEYPIVTPAILDRVAQYDRTDVAGLLDLFTATGELPIRERRVWELDQVINQRGVHIDVEFVEAAKQIAESTSGALASEFGELTGGLSPHQTAKVRDWLTGQGYSLPNLQEVTVAEALDHIAPDQQKVRRVLEIRAITASTSLKKLDAMLACVGSDGRARGLFQYHAATPGRWSGTLLQPQNLPRPTYEIPDAEALIAAIKTSNADALTPWGEPLEVLAGALRYAIAAQDGAFFGIGDFSMIETCILLALAGQHDKVALIEAGVDVYRDMAAQIFGLDRDAFLAIPDDKMSVSEKEQRRIGKNTVLGCGYQMGEERFRQQYLRHLQPDEAEALAARVIETYRKEWAPKVPELWRDLELTARRAMVLPCVTATAKCGISYRLEQKDGLPPALVCQLLNGKLIHYANAKLSDKADAWGRPKWTYWAMRRGQWREVEPYGGQLTENVVQALARELLVDAMFRSEAHGFPVVMHVHDEIVVEHRDITNALVEEIMSERPDWAVKLGVPVAVKGHVSKRYCK